MLFFFTSVRFQNDPINFWGNPDLKAIRLRVSIHLFRREQFHICIFAFCFFWGAFIDWLPHAGILIVGDHQIMPLIGCSTLSFSQLDPIQIFLKIDPDPREKKDTPSQYAKDCQCRFFHSFHSFWLFFFLSVYHIFSDTSKGPLRHTQWPLTFIWFSLPILSVG